MEEIIKFGEYVEREDGPLMDIVRHNSTTQTQSCLNSQQPQAISSE
jgi:hypothetical protein